MQLIATDNKQVVIGLGITGLSCVRYLAANNKPFSVVDSRENPPGLDAFKAEFPDISLTLGEISETALAGADELVVSPGVAIDEPEIVKAVAKGAHICGDIDLFCKAVDAPVIAITGSNGKSTVTTLVGEMIERSGRKVAVGGNIGTPALDLLAAETPDIYVLELSSFQLERSENLSVEVATVLNVSADHMDRYNNILAYHQAKHRIFHGCKKVVINRADALSRPLLAEGVEVFTFGLSDSDFNGFGVLNDGEVESLAYQFKPLMPVSELAMVGRHNIENALAAMALAAAVGVEIAPMLDVLRQFPGLEHRCQYAGEHQGVRFYNDSKGTNVGAAIASINGLKDNANDIVLIAGGDAKGADFSPLLPVLKQSVKNLVLIGNAAQALSDLCSESLNVHRADSMEQAVNQAVALANQGDVVLLSPACASFDMFDNYQHRGEVFVAAVQQFIGDDS
ncbi:UDP-N-acetylmuramoyl-L-alanine--D-glutamate ligase [Oceanicoccus sagamiensis]|uniref:UDP-N-acetylmuramoylalanine--D-glutamate ligase n=1 Tax=Oceanicoccus sagamiensis TaxID=716816 RepID=A0A1X9N9F5_9GAMM|nr:UDP-N-acetylmuramoyl-L-alanine--D-glutamate ligase [Oceanicoccus sagamiensis]ARN74718.1 UDP-N-acetylmuramoyl-L-alanine--D-glutamate ligase [Oceanicoccus sagamiensis]